MYKLRTIVIPEFNIENATLEEAVDLLRKQAVGLDTAEPDPSRKGINFVVRNPAPKPASGESLPNPEAEPGALRIKSLHLRNVPLAAVLKYICDATRFRFQVDDFAVTLVHRDAPEDLFTRTFSVPPDFLSSLDSGSGENRPPAMELLKAAGIHFGEGSSVTWFSSGGLMVTNTPSELDKIELLIATIATAADSSESSDPTIPVPATPVPAKPGE